MGTRLIFMAPLPNTECVWLVACEQPIPQEQKQMIEEYKHGLITDLKHHMGEDAYSQIPEPRGYLYGHNEQAQWRYFIDFSAANVEA